MIKIVDTKEFETVVKKGVVVVDFFATWCMPCKMFSRVIDEISKEMDGKVKFVKVDVDKNPDIANQFQVMSIPTTIVFKDGINKESIVGFMPKDVIKKDIEKQL